MRNLDHCFYWGVVFYLLLLLNAATAAPPAEGDASAKLAAAAGREFAFDLYARLAAERDNVGKNLFFSPYSMSSALAMAAEGARGETTEQMGQALHFPNALHHPGADAQ